MGLPTGGVHDRGQHLDPVDHPRAGPHHHGGDLGRCEVGRTMPRSTQFATLHASGGKSALERDTDNVGLPRPSSNRISSCRGSSDTMRMATIRSRRRLGRDVSDSLGVEHLLDLLPQRSLQSPLATGRGLDDQPHRDTVGAHRLDPEPRGPSSTSGCQAGRSHTDPAAVRMCSRADSRSALIDTSTSTTRHRPQLRLVADAPDLAVGDVPHGAVEPAQDGGAQRHPRRCRWPLRRSTASPIPYWSSSNMNTPAMQSRDEALGAEADRHAGDARAGQQRCRDRCRPPRRC